jgi:type II secretory pathway pseudopilin PulG
VIRNEAALRILIEGAMVPDQATIVGLVDKGLRQLGLGDITPQVQLYGQQLGQSLPAWDQSINLGADDLGANMFSFDTVTVELPKASSEPTVCPVGHPPQPTRTASSVRMISSTPDVPKSYLVPSILVLLLTIFPISLVPIIYSTQVAGKFDRGDHAGAELASSRAKLWCQINAGVAAAFWLLVVGVVVAGFSSISRVAARAEQEREVTERLSLIMRAEQSYYLENNRFAPNLSALGVIPSTAPKAGASAKLKDVYTYTVTVLDANSMQITAIPKRKDRHSFTTGVFFQGTGEDASLSGMTCRSMRPTMTAVKVPLLTGGRVLSCAAGAQPVTNNDRSTTNDDEGESPNDRSAEAGFEG